MNRDRLSINQIYLALLHNLCCDRSTNKSIAVHSIFLLLAIASIMVGVPEAIAATDTVSNITDTLDTSDPNYEGSLGWAIEQAETNLGTDTIKFSSSLSRQKIDLTKQDPQIAIADSDLSPLAGQLIINEVLYAQTGSNSAAGNDEFIELFNTSNNSIDLSGFQLIDGNLLVSVTDDPKALDGNTGSITGSKSPYVFPDGTILQPGEYAVIWIGDRDDAGGTQIPERFAPGAAFQDWLGSSPKLNNTGDDVWLYDADTKVIDYIAYGMGNAINTRPDPSLNLWDSTHENKLDSASRGQSISLTPNGHDGNTSACWEKTAIAITNVDSASGRCTEFSETRDTDSAVVDSNQRITSVGKNNNGTVGTTPKLLLVKRITAINPGQSDEIQFNSFVDDGTADNEDNASNWPDGDDTYLWGATTVADIQPGDEVEYTIYFLSNGDADATNVKICDVIPDNMSFVTNSYDGDSGIALLNSSASGATPTTLSNAADTDRGTFYAPGTALPTITIGDPSQKKNLCQKIVNQGNNTFETVEVNAENNVNGAVVVEIETIPPAKEDPVNSYGFIRFRAEVQ